MKKPAATNVVTQAEFREAELSWSTEKMWRDSWYWNTFLDRVLDSHGHTRTAFPRAYDSCYSVAFLLFQLGVKVDENDKNNKNI